MVKVLHLLGFYPEIGGPVRSTGLLIKGIENKGVRCKIVSPIPYNYDVSKIEILKKDYDVEYYPLTYFSKFFPSYSSKFASTIENIIDDFDIIHLHGVFDYYTYFVCKNKSDKPIVLSPRGSLIEFGFNINLVNKMKKSLYIKSLGKMIFDRVDAIHLTSEYEFEEFQKVVGIKYNSKIHIIPNGINIDNSKYSEDLFLDKYNLRNKRIILFLGRIHKVKGLNILIQAFARLVTKYKDLILVISGPDENGYKNIIDKLIETYKIKNYVLFTGMIDGELKWSAYRSAEIFVLPSYTENFGMVVIEAMVCGVPVILSNRVGIYRDVEKKGAGVIIEPNVDSLYNGIRTLLDNRELAIKTGENGREMVKEYYDINAVSDKMIGLYKQLIHY